MRCSRAFYRILAGDLLTAVKVGAENKQAASLSGSEIFPKLQGAGKCKAVVFGGV